MLKKIFDFLTYPIEWFWDKATEAWKNQQYIKAILIGIASLLGIVSVFAALAFLLYLIWEYLKNHPRFTAISIFIVFLYGYVKYNRKNVKINASDISIDANQIKQGAEAGYLAMQKVVFTALKDIANDYGMIKPNFPEEIEVHEARYVTRDKLCLYQYKIEKQDYSTSCEESWENELKNVLQKKITAILHNGIVPDIKMLEYRGPSGERCAAVVVDQFRDMGSFYYVYTAYGSAEYLEYQRNRDLNKRLFNQNHKEMVEEWKETP